MSGGIWTAASGATNQLMELDTAANNLANVNTTAYRGQHAVFKSMLAQAKEGSESQGSKVEMIAVNTTSGAITQTRSPLDVAIRNDGYFMVQSSQGERYTRAGNFELGKDGSLQTKDGLPVLDEGHSPIRIARDGSEVHINPDGSILQKNQVVGKIGTVRFNNASSVLAHDGGNLLRASASPETCKTDLEVGALESSNVSAVRGMVNVISASRAFEACEKAIEAFKQADARAATAIMGKE